MAITRTITEIDGRKVRVDNASGDTCYVDTQTDGAWRCVGYYYATPYGIFANPNHSQIQTIPCDSAADALATVLKLGRATA